jgi:proline iminopeptidase
MMKVKVFIFVFILILFKVQSQELYSKAYGKSSDPAIIFMHGGPGYNSVNFEFSSAEDLVKRGFYVIVFDQRGCGRSKNYTPNNSYAFKDQIEDVLSLYKKYNISKASIIGHSWGGTLATKFAEHYPDKVQKLIFIGSPLSYQMTFKGILSRCSKKFADAKDSVNLKRVAHVSKMDTATLSYSGTCFMFAMANGFYTPAAKSEFSENFANSMKATENNKYLAQMESEPVQGVFDTEKYILLNLYPGWLNLRKTIPLYGLYGSDDGLFEEKQLSLIEDVVTEQNFYIIKGASHNVFIDKHEEFLTLISKIFNK